MPLTKPTIGQPVWGQPLNDALSYLEQQAAAAVAVAAGLSNVNNTSDANKPVSIAQAAAIAAIQGQADLVGALKAPVTIAHRGGLRLYPEESMEGMRAATAGGFLPECDVRFLTDGTPVLCHDDTVDRTMTGISGAVDAATPAQWRAARLKPVYEGGNSARPVFFEQYLNELGNRIVLIPEIKPGATNAEAQTLLDMATARGLRRSIIFQSFDYAICQYVAAAGFQAMYLFGSALPAQTPTAIKSAGINYVGPSSTMTSTNMNTLNAAALRVVPYTIRTPSQAAALPASVFGNFSDDPWWTSGQMQAAAHPGWVDGTGWSGRNQVHNGSAGPAVEWAAGPTIAGEGLYIPRGVSGDLYHVDLRHLVDGGLLSRPFVMSAKFQFLPRAFTENGGVGFTIYRNTVNSEAFFNDAADMTESCDRTECGGDACGVVI